MPQMKNKKTGEVVEELPYTNEGVNRAYQMQAENPDVEMVKTQKYQTGGLVEEKRVRTKTRGTGAATRGLDFYKVS
ncbi:hypothetical protein CMI37_28240 [Candidatus Pacearchaeota archaeon]|nr:hypothetical protein [Candidatus Pacearchaeota archaeon]